MPVPDDATAVNDDRANGNTALRQTLLRLCNGRLEERIFLYRGCLPLVFEFNELNVVR